MESEPVQSSGGANEVNTHSSSKKRTFSSTLVNPLKCRKKVVTTGFLPEQKWKEKTDDSGLRRSSEENKNNNDIPCQVTTCNSFFKSISQCEYHYNSYHRNVCNHCKKIFLTAYWLDIHVLENHDTMFPLLAKKKPMFECLENDCDQKFWTNEERQKHLISTHKFEENFNMESSASQKPRNKKSTISKGESATLQVQETQDFDKENLTLRSQKPGTSENVNMCSNTADSSLISPSGSKNPPERIPKSICFGQGSQRSFHNTQQHQSEDSRKKKPKKKKSKKHWHENEGMDTTVDIEQVKMDDLASALDVT